MRVYSRTLLMPRIAPTRFGVFWCACVVMLSLSARAHAGDGALAADLDGDGQRDHVSVSSHEPTVVRVWLSRRQTTAVIRTREPLLRVATVDLDGDDCPELITSGRSHGLQIWKKKRDGFRKFRPKRRASPGGLSRTTHRAFDEGQAPGLPGTDTARHVSSFLTLSARPRAPTGTTWRASPRPTRAPAAIPYLTPSAPRPPPHFPL